MHQMSVHIPRSQSMQALQAALVALVVSTAVLLLPGIAFAQVIIATVNNAPITNIDLEQRIKLLKVLRKPATPETALDSLIDDRVKSEETKKYQVKAGDAEANHELARVAAEMKLDPNALLQDLQRAGVSPDHYKGHFGSDYTFLLLIQALNKGIEASETEVRAELEKQGGKAAAGTEYAVRQIVLPLLASSPQATVEARSHLAEQIRSRFTDCDSGAAMIRAMDDAVIRNTITRTSLQLGEGLKQLLDKTTPGHVTPPQRTAEGIEMLALCSKGQAKDDTSAREAIAQKILAARYAADATRRLKELRSYAVIQKR